MPEDEPPCHSSTPILRLEKYAPTVSTEDGTRTRWATWMATERLDLVVSEPVSRARRVVEKEKKGVSAHRIGRRAAPL